MTIWQDIPMVPRSEQAQREDALVSRCLILILVALAIFTGSMYLVFGHADAQQPTWAQTMTAERGK